MDPKKLEHDSLCENYIYFEKIEAENNSRKFFSARFQRDLFDGCLIVITKGRIDGAKRVVTRGHSSVELALKDFRGIVRKRVKNGYKIEEAQLTPSVRQSIELLVGNMPSTHDSIKVDSALYHSLKNLSYLLYSSPDFADYATSFQRVIGILDPQNSDDALSVGISRQRELPDLFKSDDNSAEDARRRVVRFFIENLLEREPLLQRALFRALQTPSTYHSENVVSLTSAHPKKAATDSPRLLSAFSTSGVLDEISARLFDGGVRTISQLSGLTEEDLRQRFDAHSIEIAEIRYLLGQYGCSLRQPLTTTNQPTQRWEARVR